MVTISAQLEKPINPCPACDAIAWIAIGNIKDYSISGESFALFECSGCHLRVTYPHPGPSEIGRYYASEDYVSHSDTRSGAINKLYHGARKYMLKLKYKWVKQATGKEKGILLDVGAGTGHFAHFMQSQGWQVVALEPDITARKVALEKLGLDIQPLEALGSQPFQSFDVITLWHVLEHVHNVAGYMDHFRSLLKPGGVLMIAVPNHTSRDANQYGTTWAAYDVPRHLWHFSPESMEKLMSRHNFTLTQKIPMPLDAFYVSMLSEKYKGNKFFGPVAAIISGLQTCIAGKKNVNHASSVIYAAR